jgi:hypothetical protein
MLVAGSIYEARKFCARQTKPAQVRYRDQLRPQRG